MATALLRKAFEKAAELPEHEQDAIAEDLIEAIECDTRRWGAAFAHTPEKLEKIAQRARAEYLAGRTEPLDPDKL